jgi:dipeptidyl aminopeptidase/acylaminoacyl peptidase
MRERAVGAADGARLAMRAPAGRSGRQASAAIAQCVALVLASLGVACAQAPPGLEHAPATSGVATPVTTLELVEARGLSGLVLSPDGRYAAVREDRQSVAENATIIAWLVVRLGDGKILQDFDAGAPRWTNNGALAAETPQWSPDSRWIYFRAVSDGQAQVWRASIESGDVEQLTRDPADVHAFSVGARGELAYAVGPATRDEIARAEQEERDTGVLLDSSIIKGFPITASFPVNGRMATYRLRSGAVTSGRATLLGTEPLSAFSPGPGGARGDAASPADLERLDAWWRATFGGIYPAVAETAATLASPSGDRLAGVRVEDASDASVSAPVRSAATQLFWSETANPPDQSVCEHAICTDADNIAIVGWAGGGDVLVFQAYRSGMDQLATWNTTRGEVRVLNVDAGNLGAYESGTQGLCRLAGSEVICIASGASTPPRLVAINVDTGVARILYDPNPHLTPERLGRVQTVTLKDRFGNTTIGRIVTPNIAEGLGPRPLVITTYTCSGFLLGGSGRDVPEHVLAGLGYTSICVDQGGGVVRRVPRFEMSRSNMDLSGLDFYEHAVRVASSLGLADPDRVMLTGFSGSATNTTFAITQSEIFTAAAVMTEGSADPIACYVTGHTRSCETLARGEGLGVPYDSRDGILRTSPALNVESIRTPLLMQLPETEYVPMMQLYTAMRDYGRAVEMYIYPGAYHYKHQPRQRLAVYDRNVDWANFWLRGMISVLPERELQNARWEDMRHAQCELISPQTLAVPRYCMN